MYWYEYMLIAIILVSFLGGFQRGLIKALLQYGHYLFAPFFIGKFSVSLAQFIINKYSFAQFILGKFRMAYYIPCLQLSLFEPNVSIVDNWNLIEFEASKFINGSEFPLLIKEVLLSLLNPQNISVISQRYGEYLYSLEDTVLYFISDIFTSGLALTIAVFIIIVVIFVLFKIIILLIELKTKKDSYLPLGSKFAGGIWAALLKVAYVSVILVLLQPIFLFLAIEFQKSTVFNFFWHLGINCRPWLEDTIFKIFLGIGG